jgi:hypothetical protein
MRIPSGISRGWPDLRDRRHLRGLLAGLVAAQRRIVEVGGRQAGRDLGRRPPV